MGALGREIRIGGLPYTVVGILESQGSAFGLSFDNIIIAPWQSPVHRLLNRLPTMIDAVLIQTPSAGAMPEAQERVRAVMRTRHGLRPGQKDDFALQTSETALAFWTKLKGYLVLAGIALPAIGLVVDLALVDISPAHVLAEVVLH